MHRTFWFALLCACALSTSWGGDVAVSIRYLHPGKAKSHAALFLFNTSGKFIRELTTPTDSQHVNPAFAPDGKSLIFTSENDKTQKRTLLSLKLAEKAPRVIEGEPPAWYRERPVAKYFERQRDEPDPDPAVPDTYPTPDGAYTIILKPIKDADPGEKNAFLKIGEKPELVPFEKMEGFQSFWELVTVRGTPFPPIDNPRIAVFHGAHNSQDGTESYVLDLAAKRIVQLSPNGGWILPWPGHPGFFATAASLYEDLGDGRTVNCNYLDLYDAELKRTRFGHAVGRFHGGSILVASEKPFNIVDTSFAEEKTQ